MKYFNNVILFIIFFIKMIFGKILLIVLFLQSYLDTREEQRIINGNKHPIFLFPGIASNTLFRYPYYKCIPGTRRIWVHYGMIKNWTACWVERMALKYFEDSNTVADSIDRIYPAAIGDIHSLKDMIKEWPGKEGEVFKEMIASLTAAGFKEGETLLGIPYDWRKSVVDTPNFYYNEVWQMIENVFFQNNGTKVNLVCHSHGCVNMAALLIKKGNAWSNSYVNTIITLGAPWGGCVKSLKAFLSGDNFDISILRDEKMFDIQKTFTSMVHLFPSTKIWSPYDKIVDLELDGFKKDYGADQIELLLQRIGRNTSILQGRQNLTDYFDGLINNTVGIQKHCLYGVAVETITKLNYKGSVSSSGLKKDTKSEGDGTVNKESLEYCVGKTDTMSYPYSNVSHMDMLTNRDIIQFIINKSVF